MLSSMKYAEVMRSQGHSRSSTVYTEMEPSAPQHLRKTQVYGTTVSLAWSQPEKYPGAVLIYVVYYSPPGAAKPFMVSASQPLPLMSLAYLFLILIHLVSIWRWLAI